MRELQMDAEDKQRGLIEVREGGREKGKNYVVWGGFYREMK